MKKNHELRGYRASPCVLNLWFLFILMEGFKMEVKRIIFDLDNTLIPWKSEYFWAFKQALKDFKLNINPDLQGNFIEAYEYTHERYDREAMATYFNEVFHTNINVDFINAWINYLGGMSEKDPKLNEFLKDLSKEYELAVLTNWFAITQFNRLKNAGIVQYFKTIHGGEKYMKPSKESFLNAAGFLVSFCIQIYSGPLVVSKR